METENSTSQKVDSSDKETEIDYGKTKRSKRPHPNKVQTTKHLSLSSLP